jgi:hypothetical protein|tara:strand:+ start:5389 stop:5772 length:384 start_codon:yes stop_codon:yes gene_type:complete
MKNNKFDLDLKFGKNREDFVASLLNEDRAKIEVKSERDWWSRTGNIAIEVECNGKPSGLTVTQADYWFHILTKGKSNVAMLMFETKKLRKIVKKFNKPEYTKMIGDRKASKCILIPLTELMTEVRTV